ncbi:dihydroxyacetone kinase subunit L [Actinoplanes bogorensis]|uniref:Dihydroxyacetone kinase subunit L n=1 Tax=Paractinoplanes bogorensis TaxID=1610840 RepID=A0ABS5YL82_9ACTN|nr:dihydroxyacetone kinase subunit DhaL [Actinoplanes bogorensis]MBU2664081.1 dihydroxyacetone kinase subunit L [Actinoplanes bogorensis]
MEVSDLTAWVQEFARLVALERDELTALDSAIGDGDHGFNMDRGLSAAVAALEASPPESPSALFKTVGMTMISKVGGASGPLYGTAFLRMAASAGSPVDAAGFAQVLHAALEGVVARGKASVGDKTMVDALTPAVEAFDAALASGGDPFQAAADAAEKGREATIPLVARKGRASYLGERSAGHPDPGATSVTLLMRAAATTLGNAG